MVECRSCGQVKTAEDYAVARVDKMTGRKIRRRDCKSCWAERMQERRATTPKPTTRTCIKCRQTKPMEAFRDYGGNRHSTKCIECTPPPAPRKYERGSGKGRHLNFSSKPPRDRPKVCDVDKPVSAYDITCPICAAGPRRPCDTRLGKDHAQRVDRWTRLVREWPDTGRELI